MALPLPEPYPDPAPRDDAGPAPAPPDDESRPSKTRLKQQMHDLQRLGQRLVELPAGQLDRVALPETLREQIDLARRIRAREGLRRQLQYIGRLMRDVDVDAVKASMAAASGESDAAVGLMHRCERWREQLLASDEALTRFLGEHRGVDAQWLNAKVRAARRERDEAAPSRHQRELYRWLHERLQEP